MRSTDDLVLATDCARGDRDGERAFERRFLADLGLTLARVPGVLGAVEDVRDELRAYVLERRPKPAIAMYRGVAPLGTWIRAIATRLALVVCEASAIRSRDALSCDIDPELEYVRAVRYGDLRLALERRLATRSVDERAALTMRFLEGRTVGDIRARLGSDRTALALAPVGLLALRAALLDDVAAAAAAELGTDDTELRAVLDCAAHARVRVSGVVAKEASRATPFVTDRSSRARRRY